MGPHYTTPFPKPTVSPSFLKKGWLSRLKSPAVVVP